MSKSGCISTKISIKFKYDTSLDSFSVQLSTGSGMHLIFNPRRACAARVTVLGLCVCVCVCLSVCLLLNISLFTCLFVSQTILSFSAADEGRKF